MIKTTPKIPKDIYDHVDILFSGKPKKTELRERIAKLIATEREYIRRIAKVESMTNVVRIANEYLEEGSDTPHVVQLAFLFVIEKLRQDPPIKPEND